MTVFHVIRSVKGGSGKTTFALHKVVGFCNKTKKTLYIDADVHASETRNLLLRGLKKKEDEEDESKKVEGMAITEGNFFSFYKDQYPSDCYPSITTTLQECQNNCTKHTLNTYMHPYKGFFSKLSELKCHANLFSINKTSSKFHSEEGKNALGDLAGKPITLDELGTVDFIFSDPSIHGRHVFGNLFQSSGKSAIGAGAYIAKMKTIFKYITEEGYDNAVIDMPPGSDTFSEHLLDCLIRFIGESKDNSLKVYYVSSADEAHIRTSVEAAIEHLHTMRLKAADSISFVYNTVNKENKISGQDDNERIAEIRKKIKNAFGTDKYYEILDFELDRLSYEISDYDETYYQCSCGAFNGLFLNAKAEAITKTNENEGKTNHAEA